MLKTLFLQTAAAFTLFPAAAPVPQCSVRWVRDVNVAAALQMVAFTLFPAWCLAETHSVLQVKDVATPAAAVAGFARNKFVMVALTLSQLVVHADSLAGCGEEASVSARLME